MTHRRANRHGQCGIQKKDALGSPTHEGTGGRWLTETEVRDEFLVHVHERWWQLGDRGTNTEGETVRVTGGGVGILTQNNDLDGSGVRTGPQCRKDVIGGGSKGLVRQTGSQLFAETLTGR